MVDKVNDSIRSPDIASIDEEISELVDLIRRARARLAEAEADVQPVINAAKERLEMLLAYRGTNWTDTSGYAQLVTEGTRVSYDTEALDQLILSDPAQYGWLKKYRNENTIQGGVRVK